MPNLTGPKVKSVMLLKRSVVNKKIYINHTLRIMLLGCSSVLNICTHVYTHILQLRKVIGWQIV
jgi:hypothetical protein